MNTQLEEVSEKIQKSIIEKTQSVDSIIGELGKISKITADVKIIAGHRTNFEVALQTFCDKMSTTELTSMSEIDDLLNDAEEKFNTYIDSASPLTKAFRQLLKALKIVSEKLGDIISPAGTSAVKAIAGGLFATAKLVYLNVKKKQIKISAEGGFAMFYDNLELTFKKSPESFVLDGLSSGTSKKISLKAQTQLAMTINVLTAILQAIPLFLEKRDGDGPGGGIDFKKFNKLGDIPARKDIQKAFTNFGKVFSKAELQNLKTKYLDDIQTKLLSEDPTQADALINKLKTEFKQGGDQSLEKKYPEFKTLPNKLERLSKNYKLLLDKTVVLKQTASNTAKKIGPKSSGIWKNVTSVQTG